jgi:hypothetical protein
VYAAIAKGFDLTAGGATPSCDPLPGLAQPGWCLVDGTSFSTPITAAAAAWVWSARNGLKAFQVADVLRAGARRGTGQTTGFDVHFGFGLVDVARSLQAQVPAGDLLEPNGDVAMVAGRSGFALQRAVLGPGQRHAHLTATAHYADDYEDLYRVDLPRGARRVKLYLRHRGTGRRSDDLNVCLWSASVRTVQLEDGPSERALLGCSRQTGARNDTLSVRVKPGTRRVYADVYAPLSTSRFAGRYTLTLARS